MKKFKCKKCGSIVTEDEKRKHYYSCPAKTGQDAIDFLKKMFGFTD